EDLPRFRRSGNPSREAYGDRLRSAFAALLPAARRSAQSHLSRWRRRAGADAAQGRRDHQHRAHTAALCPALRRGLQLVTAAPQQGAPAGGRAVFGAAIKGGRTDQQDSFRLCRLDGEGGWLLLLADGMGGHAAGALASKIAADTFVAAFRSLRAEGTSLADALGGALTRANEAIAAAQRLDPDNSAGMGTTVVAAH